VGRWSRARGDVAEVAELVGGGARGCVYDVAVAVRGGSGEDGGGDEEGGEEEEEERK